MREILFRGKRMDSGQWVEAASILSANDGLVKEVYLSAKSGAVLHVDADGNPVAVSAAPHALFYRVDPDTLGQFTGLTDKNGRKVFEGDILKEEDIVVGGGIQIQGDVWSVGMRKGCWVVKSAVEWDFLSTNAGKCAVIGNIHDTPELLNQ